MSLYGFTSVPHYIYKEKINNSISIVASASKREIEGMNSIEKMEDYFNFRGNLWIAVDGRYYYDLLKDFDHLQQYGDPTNLKKDPEIGSGNIIETARRIIIINDVLKHIEKKVLGYEGAFGKDGFFNLPKDRLNSIKRTLRSFYREKIVEEFKDRMDELEYYFVND